METWQEMVNNRLIVLDFMIQALLSESTPAARDKALQEARKLCKVLEGLRLEEAQVEGALSPGPKKVIEPGPGDVLSRKDMELLERARRGELPCPRCSRTLDGEFVYFPLEEGDCYAGVRLHCLCGFVEY